MQCQIGREDIRSQNKCIKQGIKRGLRDTRSVWPYESDSHGEQLANLLNTLRLPCAQASYGSSPLCSASLQKLTIETISSEDFATTEQQLLLVPLLNAIYIYLYEHTNQKIYIYKQIYTHIEDFATTEQ